jgi:hypothetical protein
MRLSNAPRLSHPWIVIQNTKRSHILGFENGIESAGDLPGWSNFQSHLQPEVGTMATTVYERKNILDRCSMHQPER